MIGYTPEEIVGTSFAHYVHPDELPKLAKFYLQRIAGEDVPNIYETKIRHKDGSDVLIEIKASVVHRSHVLERDGLKQYDRTLKENFPDGHNLLTIEKVSDVSH